MFSKFIGIIWIIFGAICLMRPDFLRARVGKKIGRRIRVIIYGFLLVFGFTLIAAILKINGILGKLFGVVGLIIVIRVIIAITGKTSDRLLKWLSAVPVMIFRVLGGLIIVAGGVLFFLR